jgi:hypothetical protein
MYANEEKIDESSTYSVTLDCDAKFTAITDDKHGTVEFTYVDNVRIRRYSAIYNYSDDVFRDVPDVFIGYVIRQLLGVKLYKIFDVNDTSVSVMLYYHIVNRELPITVKLNVNDFTAAAEGSISEVEYLKAQISQMRTEMNIMKNVLAHNVNKVRITLSTVTDQNFVCKDKPNDKTVLRIPDRFLQEVNDRVLTDFAKIVEVRVKKISHFMKIDVELELFSKECYYFLSHQAKTEFETKSFENINKTLNESSGPIFFGSNNIADPFSTNLNTNGTEIVGIYLVLYDRRKRNADARSINLSIHNDHHRCYNKLSLCLDRRKYFPIDQFPLNNLEEHNGSLYAITIDKKEIDDIKDIAYQRQLINERAIIEKLLEP